MELGEGINSYVKVTVTSNLNSSSIERRFPFTLTLLDLKGKLELVTGGSSSTMQLELRNKDGEQLKNLSDDSKTLEECGFENGMIVHVIDKDTNNFDGPDDVAFELTEEDYARREESARQFLIKNKLGKFDDQKILKKQEDEARESVLAENISIGSRCDVTIQGAPSRRGEIKYVGKVHFKPGHWVGIQYDEPVGKNDGTIDGIKYFECQLKYGGFVRPSAIQIGDFPELGLEDLDEI